MRTNIELNDELVKKAMAISQLKTKKEVVERALQDYVDNHSRLNLLDLKGQIKFAEGYDHKALREGRHVDIG